MSRRMSSPHLVGREEQLGLLGELFDEASAGRPWLVLVGGDAGTGKSRLLGEFTERVRDRGARVLVGHCVDLGDSALPFAPFAQAMRVLKREVDERRLPELLGEARRELSRILPELGDPQHGRVDAEEARAQLFGGLSDALRRLADDAPLVLGVEDLHWADASTLDLLTYLARDLDGRLLVVATFRTDELHRRHPVAPVIGELSRLPRVRRLDLGPLTDTEVRQLVTAILGRPPSADLLQEVVARAAGNAFFVEELVATSPDQLASGGGSVGMPPGLRDVLVSRLAPLDGDTRRVAEVAAVAGERVGHGLLARVVELEASLLTSALRGAVDHHVLTTEGDGYRFRHALVREALADELLPGERIELHRRIAEVLEQQPELASAGPDQVDAELAHHWYAARDATRAFETSLAAAEQARDMAAFGDALEHYERVLELWEQVDQDQTDTIEVLRATAEVASAAGRPERAVRHLRYALQVGTAADVVEADLRRRLVKALWDAGHEESALAEIRHANTLVADAEASATRAQVLLTHASLLRLHVQSPTEASIPLAREAAEAARAIADRQVEARSLLVLGSALCWTGSADEGIDHLRAGLEIASELDDRPTRIRAHSAMIAAYGALVRRDSEERELAERALALVPPETARTSLEVGLVSIVGYTFLRTGQWQHLQRVLDRLQQLPLGDYTRGPLHHLRGSLRLAQGRLEQASTDVARLRELGIDRWKHDQLPLEAELAAADRRWADVRTIADEHRAFEVDPHEEAMRTGTLLQVVRAETDAALDATGKNREEHIEAARNVVEEMRDLAARDGLTIQFEEPSTNVLIAEAELSRVTGPDPSLWREAEDHAWYEHTKLYAGWRLAEALLGVDEREEAVAQLRRSHEHATALGAGLVLGHIESLARRARVHLPGVPVTEGGDLGLTPRETQVLGLVAQGNTNRQIGESLYITGKTASVHVSNILSKLEVDSRQEAAARARELGLVGRDTPDDQPSP